MGRIVHTIAAVLILAPSAASATCSDPRGAGGKARTRCASPPAFEAKRFEPYDPGRARAGSRPGFTDVGGGTEVRVGGRTRVEFQTTR